MIYNNVFNNIELHAEVILGKKNFCVEKIFYRV